MIRRSTSFRGAIADGILASDLFIEKQHARRAASHGTAGQYSKGYFNLMPPIHRFVLAVTLCIATTSSFSAPLQGDKLGTAIEGVWCTSFDEGKTCLGYDEYRNGKITSCGAQTSTGAPSLVEGRYNIHGNRSCSFVISSNDPIMKPGTQVCIEILDIDRSLMLFRYTRVENMELHLNPENQSPGQGIPLYRVPPSQMVCRDAGK